MSAAGAGAAVPGQPTGPIFGGRRPGYWIRHMNGRSTTLQAPDGSTVEVPTAHMPRGSAPGQPLDEQAFMAGHQQRQVMSQARSPFARQLAQQAPAQQGGASFTPRPVTPGMMIQPGSAPVTQNAQTAPIAQAPAAEAVAAPGTVAAAPLPPSAAAPPVPAASPPPSPKGVAYGSQQMLDYLKQYGPGDTGLSQEQVDALIGKPTAGPNAATIDWNQRQQQFGANNPLYGITGYQGNAQQVASQVAGGAQSAGIPMGVLGSSFYQGGADYGGQQNAGNSMNGNNGAVNWNDPTVANYGVSDASYIPALVQSLQAAKAGLGSTPLTTGQVGNFVSAVPGIVNSPQFQAGMAAQQQQQQATQYQATPAAAGASFTSQLGAVGPSSSGSVDYTPRQPAVVQPAQGTVSGGGYTPPTAATQTQLVNAPQTQQNQQPQTTQGATQKLTGTLMQSTATSNQQQGQAAAAADSAFQKALANAQVAPLTGPATESRTGRAHF